MTATTTAVAAAAATLRAVVVTVAAPVVAMTETAQATVTAAVYAIPGSFQILRRTGDGAGGGSGGAGWSSPAAGNNPTNGFFESSRVTSRAYDVLPDESTNLQQSFQWLLPPFRRKQATALGSNFIFLLTLCKPGFKNGSSRANGALP